MNTQNWQKKGLVHVVDGQFWWAKTHAQVPTVDRCSEDRLRIYFSSRDDQNRSRIGMIEVDASDPRQVLYVHPEPILDLGPVGTFDDCGVIPSWIVRHEGLIYLYYIGFNVRNTIPYHNSIGLAVSEDGVNFRRVRQGPIIDRTADEPYFCTTSCVLIEQGRWRNWYLSCTEWTQQEGGMEPRYHLKYAESQDGIYWERNGVVAIDYKSDSEGGIVRASVLRHGDGLRMWYSYRDLIDYRTNSGSSYRVGYAESPDGKTWTRMDEASGIAVSPGEWDGFMLAYPHVIEHRGKLLMFYNGDGFGRSGFGYAELDQQ
ncbi:hypothetical protein LJR289_002824 [Pseudoduganella sp. LjRoot289]|uniref:hypothetical protein n=1 Tax=Pseudoduganella sp. LjRoot289 TaxID=3342314 RepID=UPI003ED08DC7